MQGIIIYRAIYFGAYDTAKEMFDNPGIVTRFAIAQVCNSIKIKSLNEIISILSGLTFI